MDRQYVKKASELKPGDKIEWEEVGPKLAFTRNATVRSVTGRNVEINDGDWRWWPDILRWKPYRV
jgi:hypothetical protein